MPKAAPTYISIKKCWSKYILEIPTPKAAIKHRIDIALLFIINDKEQKRANAAVVCPDGKLRDE
tara:strand:+ start:571 stop:762 length:192 start_codon:yes stop_codon:yes gene_type:complete